MSASRSPNLSGGYIKLNLVFTTEAFLYLLAGLIAMIISFLPFVTLNRDAIYILWLFGFVGSMVFGITNIMMPSYGNKKEFRHSLIVSEIISLNTGTIATFIGLNGFSEIYLVISGLTLLVIATLIHLIDLSSTRLA
ncbi:MAG: hypothetical protein M0Z77_02700 [Thermoplasmatales archaeon]|jgi:hypothetical protein|nr:hypothetical protein [Thermoplasmatales archaeon]